jgi:dCTP diphosphatase
MEPTATIEELRERVRAFAEARDWRQFHSPRNLAMALQVEAAELLEVFLWSADGDPQPAPERRAAAIDEIGDVLICLVNLADRMGVDPVQAALDKLHRAEAKYPADRVRGKSAKYDEYPEWKEPG